MNKLLFFSLSLLMSFSAFSMQLRFNKSTEAICTSTKKCYDLAFPPFEEERRKNFTTQIDELKNNYDEYSNTFLIPKTAVATDCVSTLCFHEFVGQTKRILSNIQKKSPSDRSDLSDALELRVQAILDHLNHIKAVEQKN